MGKIIDFKTPKKKKNNNQSKKVDTLFDKSADIYTNNNGEYHIRKNRIYICGSNFLINSPIKITTNGKNIP